MALCVLCSLYFLCLWPGLAPRNGTGLAQLAPRNGAGLAQSLPPFLLPVWRVQRREEGIRDVSILFKHHSPYTCICVEMGTGRGSLGEPRRWQRGDLGKPGGLDQDRVGIGAGGGFQEFRIIFSSV